MTHPTHTTAGEYEKREKWGRSKFSIDQRASWRGGQRVSLLYWLLWRTQSMWDGSTYRDFQLVCDLFLALLFCLLLFMISFISSLSYVLFLVAFAFCPIAPTRPCAIGSPLWLPSLTRSLNPTPSFDHTGTGLNIPFFSICMPMSMSDLFFVVCLLHGIPCPNGSIQTIQPNGPANQM